MMVMNRSLVAENFLEGARRVHPTFVARTSDICRMYWLYILVIAFCCVQISVRIPNTSLTPLGILEIVADVERKIMLPESALRTGFVSLRRLIPHASA
jgi:hypothetical protein